MDKFRGAFGVLYPGVPVRYPESSCVVCSAPATGVHYGVVACNGCKAFYHRSVKNKSVYQCKYTEQCTIGPQATGRCRSCRFAKCMEVGMKLDSTPMGRVPRWKRNTCLAADVHAFRDTRPQEKVRVGRRGFTANIQADLRVRGSAFPNYLTASPLDSGAFEEASTLRSYLPLRDVNRSVPGILSTAPFTLPEISGQRSPKIVVHSVTDLAYLDSTMKETVRVWDTICAMHSAQRSVYGDDDRVWESVSTVNGDIPYEPQFFPAAMERLIRSVSLDAKTKNIRMFMRLPGFATFSQESQQQMLTADWPLSGQVVHFRHLGENGIYLRQQDRAIGFFFSAYWMSQVMNAAVCQAAIKTSKVFRDLQLTDLEVHLLHVVSVFAPDSTTAEDRVRLELMQSHYADCLRFVIRNNYQDQLSATDVRHREDRIFDLVELCRSYNAMLMAQPIVHN